MQKRNITYIAVIVAVVVTFLFFLVKSVSVNHMVTYGFFMAGLVGLWISSMSLENRRDSYPWSISVPTAALQYSMWALGILVVSLVLEQVVRWQVPIVWLVFVELLVIGFYSVRIIMLAGGLKYLRAVGDRTAGKVSFIKDLTLEAGLLVGLAEDTSLKNELQALCDKLRYSDPMSHDSLGQVEHEMGVSLAQLKDAVLLKDSDLAKASSVRLGNLIEDRNKRCLILK
jgi:hypothetical protein